MKKITFYLGLCDQTTKLQKFSTIEAYKTCINLVGATFGGGTVYEGFGFYKHDDGVVVKEKSLIITTVTDLDYKEFIKTLKVLFNQESIMVEVSQPSISFE